MAATMVRIKHRYLLFNILYPATEPRRDVKSSDPPYLAFHPPSPPHLTAGLLIGALRSSIALHFGDVGVGLTSPSLKIVYFSPATSTVIVRCPRQHFRLIWAALTYMTTIPGSRRGETIPCVLQVSRVSGTIRKSEEELMRRSKRDIVRAKEWEASAGDTSGVLSRFLGGGVKSTAQDLAMADDAFEHLSEDDEDMVSE